MKLMVVGRGIAGSSFAHHAREAGHAVTIYADPALNTASLAALCVVRRDWFPAGPLREMCDWTVGWYRRHGWISGESCAWSTWRHPGFRIRDGFVTVNPNDILVTTAGGFDLRKGQANLDDGFDAVVLCRGAQSDLDWKRSWGVTSLYDIGWDHAAPLSAYEDRPRNALYAVQHPEDRHLRFGSSKAPSLDLALARQSNDEAKARVAGIVPPDPSDLVLTGQRLMPPTAAQTGEIRRLGPRVWATEGYGRVGFSIAPARTYELLQTITRELS